MWAFGGVMVGTGDFTAAECLFCVGNVILAAKIATSHQIDHEQRPLIIAIVLLMCVGLSYGEYVWVERKKSTTFAAKSPQPEVVPVQPSTPRNGSPKPKDHPKLPFPVAPSVPVNPPKRSDNAESLVYMVPGGWVTAPQPAWLMQVEHFGPDPVFNIEILFVDKDRQAALSKKSFSTPEDIQSMQRTLNFPEIDSIVGVWAKAFLWPVLNPDDSHYEATIASRNGEFFETFEVKKDAEGKWVNRITVANQLTKKVLIDCRDPNFIEVGNSAALPRCFPEYTVGRNK
jgi:hypothetical protein